jgi:hypothetical protein
MENVTKLKSTRALFAVLYHVFKVTSGPASNKYKFLVPGYVPLRRPASQWRLSHGPLCGGNLHFNKAVRACVCVCIYLRCSVYIACIQTSTFIPLLYNFSWDIWAFAELYGLFHKSQNIISNLKLVHRAGCIIWPTVIFSLTFCWEPSLLQDT